MAPPGGINWADINWETTTPTGLLGLLTISGRAPKYAQSKAANVILSAEAARRWSDSGVISLVRPPPPPSPPCTTLTQTPELESRQPEVESRPHDARVAAVPARHVPVLSSVLRRADGVVCGPIAGDHAARAFRRVCSPVGQVREAEERYCGGGRRPAVAVVLERV